MMSYNELREKGFFCYCSNRQGDLFRNSRFKGIKIVGSCFGFKVYIKCSWSFEGYELVKEFKTIEEFNSINFKEFLK